MTDIEYYREFAMVAATLNFSRAAEELCVSQPALSKHIAALERELGVQLLVRTPRRVELSDAGRLILPYARTMAELDGRVRAIAREQQLKKSRAVRGRRLYIASIPVMAAYDITGSIARFYRLHPDIMAATSEYEPASIPRLLAAEQFELAFLRRPLEGFGEEYEAIEFSRERVIAVLPAGHRLANRKRIELAQLKDENLLLIGEQAQLHSICRELCLQAGFTPSGSFSGLRPENIIDLVSLGMGVTILTEAFYRYYRRADTVQAEITPTAETSICLVKQRGRKLSEEAQLFWDFIDAAGSGQPST